MSLFATESSNGSPAKRTRKARPAPISFVAVEPLASPIQQAVEQAINWSDPQTPYFIAAQTGVPVVAKGPPGVAKGALTFAFARRLQRKLLLLIASCRAPEDFSGLPTPDYEMGYVRMMPMDWARTASVEPCVVFLDEINTADGHKRAPMLSMLTENRIGDTQLHPDTIYMAAMNPFDMAENGSPLSFAMRNRFYHHTWELDVASWRDGLINERGCLNWGEPSYPILPSNWRDHMPVVASLVSGFLLKAPDRALVQPEDDETDAYPTPRSWTNLIKVLAAARSLDCPADVRRRMMECMIGRAASVEFSQHCEYFDLVDPERVLSGQDKWQWDDQRTDRNSVFLASLFVAVKGNKTQARWERAVELLLEAGKHCPEMALLYIREARELGGQDAKWSPALLRGLADLNARTNA